MPRYRILRYTGLGSPAAQKQVGKWQIASSLRFDILGINSYRKRMFITSVSTPWTSAEENL
jgi:hypothetical protein